MDIAMLLLDAQTASSVTSFWAEKVSSIGMIILTDFQKFPRRWRSSGLDGDTHTTLAGIGGTDLIRLIPDIRKTDILLIHESGSKVLWLVLLFWILPFLKKPIISVDIILRKPNSAKEKIVAGLKRILLRRVDHFIHYFKKLDGYENIYRISPNRSSYVPFKANLYGDPSLSERVSKEQGQYVFSAGWSLRDYDTFFEAIQKLNYPSAMFKPNIDRLGEHGARLTRRVENFPSNLTLLEDDGSRESWIRTFSKARVVVIPILKDSIRAAGISVYLDAMILKKCVVITDGPGVSDVLTDQALIVPRAIPRLWRVLSKEFGMTRLFGKRWPCAATSMQQPWAANRN